MSTISVQSITGVTSFDFSNTTFANAYNVSNSGYGVANSGYGVANGAFGKANSAFQNTAGTFEGALTVKNQLSVYSDPLPNGKCIITSYGQAGLTRITSANTTAGGGTVAIGREPVLVHGMPAGYYNVELWSGANGSTQTMTVANGNIGVGVSPGTKLDISGTTRIRGAGLIFSVGTTQKGVVGTYDVISGSGTDYSPTIFAETGLGLYFSINGSATKAMTLDASGNLGIGTAPNSYPFEINTPFGSAVINSTTTTNRVWMKMINGGGELYIGRENSAGSAFGVTAYSSLLWSQGAYPMVFATNSTERMRLDTSGNTVLVGATSPAYATGSTRGSVEIYGSTDSLVALRNSVGNAYIQHNAENLNINNLTNGYMLFGTNNTERMRIDAGGKVGVATTTPTGIFDVRPSQATTGKGASVIIKAQRGQDGYDGGNLLLGSGDNGVGGGNGYIAFGVGSVISANDFTTTSETARFSSSGYFGIGTTNPQYKMHVANGNFTVTSSTGAGQIQITDDSDSNRGLLLKSNHTNSGNTYVGTNSSIKNLILGIDQIEKARIDTSGNFWFTSGYGSSAIAYGTRAWAKFNGTSAVGGQTVNGSGNISSVSKTASGYYTVNFSSAMPDTNYNISASAGNAAVDRAGISPDTYATGSFRLFCWNVSGSGVDMTYATFSVHR